MLRRAALLLLPIIYLGFVSLGLPDGTLGIAWPRMHLDLGQPLSRAGMLMIVATLLSATASFSSGRIQARFRTGPIVLVSCLLTGGALLVTAQVSSFAWLLVAAVPLGLGGGAVDSALNSYVARHYSGRHMSWLHACWGIGATTGPLIMTQALASSHGWRGGYLFISMVQLLLAGLFAATLRLWDAVPAQSLPTAHAASSGDAFCSRHAAHSEAGWLSSGLFLLYSAVEVTTGLWANSVLVVGRSLPPVSAGLCVALFYAAITAGRIANGLVVDRWGNRRMVKLGAALALAGVALFAFASSVPLAALALALTGLGLAPIYPGLMHEVPRRFHAEAVATIIGRQSGAACLGAAFFPAAAGWVGGMLSLESIAWALAAGAVALLAALRRLDRIS